jgi:hypothetical protein
LITANSPSARYNGGCEGDDDAVVDADDEDDDVVDEDVATVRIRPPPISIVRFIIDVARKQWIPRDGRRKMMMTVTEKSNVRL